MSCLELTDTQVCNIVEIAMRIQVKEVELRLFSMFAQFGSVQEISLGDARVELFFPQDDISREFFRAAEDGAACSG
jgi:hypothetical protein